jgi:capsular exopolysaccharide synthesis family protein
LSANLAISVASSGKRVLLIDADFRRPRIAAVFGMEDSIGFSTVIAGDASLAEAVQQTDVEFLTVLPCGPRPKNPAEELTSPRFQQILDQARDGYDLVLVDTPPLLAVTDPSVVAPRVDTVLLVVSLTRNARDVAHRATEVLESIGASIMGVVVNRFEKNSGYASRDYRYGGGYGYQYGDRYGYSRHGENGGPGKDSKRRRAKRG